MVGRTESEQLAEAAGLIDHEAVRRKVPSLAVSVSRDGHVLWSHGAGTRFAPTPDTSFALASVTKPMTATALMLLVDRGLVDLDAPAGRYLEHELTARVGEVGEATVRRLANHTAGLPMHFRFLHGPSPVLPTPAELITRYGVLVSPPGEQFRYSNLGYGLLEHIISVVAGMPYQEFLRRELLEPLGMVSSWVGPSRGLATEAGRYDEHSRPIPPYAVDIEGASGAWSSTNDLLRFASLHLGCTPGLLSTPALHEMQRRSVDLGSGKFGWGVGWMLADELGYDTVSHGGGMTGVTTLLHLVPSERLAVAVLANCESTLPLFALGCVLSAVLPGYGDRWQALDDPEHHFLPDVPNYPFEPPKPHLRPPAELTGAWAGRVATYEGDKPLELRFDSAGSVSGRLDGRDLASMGVVDAGPDRVILRLTGHLRTSDTVGWPSHELVLDLRLRAGGLTGAIMAVPHLEAPSAHEEVYDAGLSYWLEATRSEGGDVVRG